MIVLATSHGALSRYDTLMRVDRGELRVDDAAALLGLKRRQIFRLLDRMRREGAEGLINSPQDKGRVERTNATLQDQLVKAMRLEGIATIAEANAFLPVYMARHNRHFAKAPFDSRDLHPTTGGA